jgi:transglutaminase-like putative cysteine protease/tetratricopeptide (TPR) repeat protein
MAKEEGSVPGLSGFEAAPPAKPAKAPALLPLILRSLALFAILYQFRLPVGDLADTPVFAAALFCAFASAWTLAKTKLKPVPAALILILLPWAVRFFIAMPRFVVSGTAVTLDSLLLGFDRNSFVFLPPFYWAALTTFFAVRSRRFLRFDIIASQGLLLAVFSVVRSADMDVYRWPVLMIAIFAAVAFLHLLALMLSLKPEYLVRKTEKLRAAAIMLILTLIGGILMIRPSQEGAVDQGGGLLQPNLFRFDFSQILRLESEIKMNDDLVLIVRRERDDYNIFLRRFVLSGYNAKQGFYRHDEIDEAAHPQRLPGGRTRLDAAPVKNYRVMDQEYFLVNFDASAFIGMNAPVEIVPFESWDASSFSSAYAVQSHVGDGFYPYELMDSVPDLPAGSSGERAVFTAEHLGLSPEEFEYYTEYGGDKRIAAFAAEISGGFTNYWEMAQAVYERLRYGEYRYSLKPGIAPDGDQLGYFLFESKKGYCSYYAFAMTLLLRSLGIPSRVAVGFFIDPEQNTFDYYPVRSDMAHAWVEVYFPQYGWIEFDPTTEQLAADEDFRFSSGIPQDLFERLMKEILENRSRLTPRESRDEGPGTASLSSLGKNAGRFIRERWALILIACLIAVFLLMRTGCLAAAALTGKPRKRAVRLWAHSLRRLALAGLTRGSAAAPESEWAQNLDKSLDLGLYVLYQDTAAARYAPSYTQENFMELKKHYESFSSRYCKTIGLPRRILAWLCPPLALVLPSRSAGTRAGLLLILLFSLNARAASAQDIAGSIADEADTLFNMAMDAQQAEFWERAIALYSEGAKLFPADTRFPWALGSLYYSRKLYGLAWDEYRRVEDLLPRDTDVLYRLSRTAGYLNRDAVSAEYLERLLSIEPDHLEAIGSLGWMYYKLHRLQDGERLLKNAVEKYGPNPDLAMTLATIYLDMFRYESSKSWYREAIMDSENSGDREFTAVAYYNLSILESRFYKYADAFEQTNASLSALNRASGRLARGELFLRRMELPQVFAEYQAAYEIDMSPLSKVNLAQAYQITGRLEEARLYAEDCLNLGDLSWMINYGIDPVRYKRDLHEILHDTYTGLAKTEERMIYGSAGEAVRGFFKTWYYRYKALSHRFLFQKYSLSAAGAYRAHTAGSGDSTAPVELEVWIQYYNAFEPYPGRALPYLRNARNYEVPLIHDAIPAYDVEEGILLKKRDLLARSIPVFDSLWERDMIADTYGELYPLLKGRDRRVERADAAERLYALNRGALRQKGISLPVDLTLVVADMGGESAGAQQAAKTERALRRTLQKMGIDPMAANISGGFSPRFRLGITVTGGEVRCVLHDGGRGIDVFRQTIPLASSSRRDLSAFARILGDLVFIEG